MWLSKDGRTMTSQQEGVIVEALKKCSLPLYARIAYDHIKRQVSLTYFARRPKRPNDRVITTSLTARRLYREGYIKYVYRT